MKATYWALVSCYAVYYAYTLKVIIIFTVWKKCLSVTIQEFLSKRKKNWRPNRGILVEHNSFQLKCYPITHQKLSNIIRCAQTLSSTPRTDVKIKLPQQNAVWRYSWLSFMSTVISVRVWWPINCKHQNMTVYQGVIVFFITYSGNNYCEIKLYKDVRQRDNKTYFPLSAFL